MNNPGETRHWELRASGRAAPALLVLCALATYWVADAAGSALPRRPTLSLVLALCGASALALALEGWRPLVGRWVSVLSVAALPALAAGLLARPSLIVLTAIAPPLAAATLGLTAAGIAATVASGLMALLAWYPGRPFDAAIFGATAALAWALTGLMVLVYRPVYCHVDWIAGFLRAAQQAVAEARERKAAIEQSATDLANANRQLALATKRMAALRQIAEDAEKAKTIFVSKVSHEFRTPLNMIIGLVDLMVEHPEIYSYEPSPKADEAMEVVLRNSRHLAALVDDVLDLTRAEAGRLTLHREHVDLGELLREAVHAVRPLTDSKGLALTVEVARDLPSVYCDETRIRQVILNLVSNAARFTDSGGIAISSWATDGRATVQVSDTGPGIPPEDIGRIFEPFSQGASVPGRDSGGSGLGLSISHQFVRLHGGSMRVESKPGSGSVFLFELPIGPSQSPVGVPGRWIREDWVWREGAFRTDRARPADPVPRARIVVSDESGALSDDLDRYACDVELLRVDDVGEAISEVENHPAMALLINARSEEAVLSGLQRAARGAPSTPVLSVSIPAVDRAAISAGAAGYLVKPVTRTDLESILASAPRRVRRALVVDDDADAAHLFGQMLRAIDFGLQIGTALGGEAAVTMFQERPYDLVLLDIAMPRMDGWQVMQELSATGCLDGTAVYFVTAQDPADRPPASPLIAATIDGGLSAQRILRATLSLAPLLVAPDQGPRSGQRRTP